MNMNIVNVLFNIGIPAGVKGFTYICDAMELFEKDSYYADGKICVLYHEIARKRETTASRVERAIRHAFETALTKGNPENVELYLDTTNTQNSNLLRTLYLKTRPANTTDEIASCHCDSGACDLKKQIYSELMDWLSNEIVLKLDKMPQTYYPS